MKMLVSFSCYSTYSGDRLTHSHDFALWSTFNSGIYIYIYLIDYNMECSYPLDDLLN